MRPVRCLFVVLAWLGSSAAWAQKGTPGQTGVVSLRWDASATLPPPVGSPTDAPGRRVPTFRGAYHGPTDAVGTYTLRLPGTATSAALREAAYEPLPEADARLLTAAETARLPATPTLTLRTGTEARRPVSFVLLQPARRNPQTGQAERLVSFRVAYETGAGVGADANLGAGPVTTPQAAARAHVTSSVLSVGDWFKLGVPRGGVYKLDGPALQKLGVNMSGLDPRRVQLYGNAAGLLPQANAAPRIDDLAENTLLFVGNNDAVLDAGEYFLFYARGPHVWRPSQPGRAARTGLPGYAGLLGEGGRWKHLTNHYCDTAYYFLTVGSRPGRRVLTPAPPAPAPTGALITRFLDRRFYEHDLTSLLRSGRRWVGESFKIGTSGAGSVSREFSFSTDGYAPLTDLTPGDTVRAGTEMGPQVVTDVRLVMCARGLAFVIAADHEGRPLDQRAAGRGGQHVHERDPCRLVRAEVHQRDRARVKGVGRALDVQAEKVQVRSGCRRGLRRRGADAVEDPSRTDLDGSGAA